MALHPNRTRCRRADLCASCELILRKLRFVFDVSTSKANLRKIS